MNEKVGIDEELNEAETKDMGYTIEAFNMRKENQEGRFDEDGFYVEKQIDEDDGEPKDAWLKSVEKTGDEMDSKTRAAANKAIRQRAEMDQVEKIDLVPVIRKVESLLKKFESPARALKRIKKGEEPAPKPKKKPNKLKKNLKNILGI